MRPDAVLLDRDGTINFKAPEGEYVTTPDELELLPGAAKAIRRLNEAEVPVSVITNQRGIALGRMTEADLAAVHARLADLLAAERARVDAIFYCPHDKDTCDCRKPGTAMLEWTRNRFRLRSLRDAVVIGDALSDVQAGSAVGARTVLLTGTAGNTTAADAVAASLAAAIDLVLGTCSPASRARPRVQAR
jgi:D-glycero-D-manno-heptose 1,7-bisphosphate phosphatase